jgi:recombination protein RecT
MSDVPQNQTALVQSARGTMLEVYKRQRVYIDKVLPEKMRGDRFAYLVADHLTQNPALAQTSPASFIRCVMAAAQLGLEIRPNSCYLIPFGAECQLLIDYRGKMDLARRSGKVGAINPMLVRDNDVFKWIVDSSGLRIKFEPAFGKDRGEVKAGFAFAEIVGSKKPQFLEPMTLEEIEARRRRSKKGVPELSLAEIRKLDATNLPFRHRQRTPWTTDWDRMAMKTLLHDLCRLLPQSPEMVFAEQVDAAFDNGVKVPAMDSTPAIEVEFSNEDEKPMIEPKTKEEMAEFAEQRINEIGGKKVTV